MTSSLEAGAAASWLSRPPEGARSTETRRRTCAPATHACLAPASVPLLRLPSLSWQELSQTVLLRPGLLLLSPHAVHPCRAPPARREAMQVLHCLCRCARSGAAGCRGTDLVGILPRQVVHHGAGAAGAGHPRISALLLGGPAQEVHAGYGVAARLLLHGLQQAAGGLLLVLPQPPAGVALRGPLAGGREGGVHLPAGQLLHVGGQVLQAGSVQGGAPGQGALPGVRGPGLLAGLLGLGLQGWLGGMGGEAGAWGGTAAGCHAPRWRGAASRACSAWAAASGPGWGSWPGGLAAAALGRRLAPGWQPDSAAALWPQSRLRWPAPNMCRLRGRGPSQTERVHAAACTA